MRSRVVSAIVWFSVLAWASGSEAYAQEAGVDFFERKIRPILVKRCYSCHSKQANKQRGGLLLDSRDGLLEGGDGGPAIVPGKPADSLLIKAVRHTNPKLKMPRDGKLPPEAILDLEHWIAIGAPDPRRGKTLAKTIALGYVKYGFFEPGTTVEVRSADQVVTATITELPFR